jgi:hypothetical protein
MGEHQTHMQLNLQGALKVPQAAAGDRPFRRPLPPCNHPSPLRAPGFDFAFMSGFCTSAARLGAPDTGLMSYYEMFDQVGPWFDSVGEPPSSISGTGVGWGVGRGMASWCSGERSKAATPHAAPTRMRRRRLSHRARPRHLSRLLAPLLIDATPPPLPQGPLHPRGDGVDPNHWGRRHRLRECHEREAHSQGVCRRWLRR